MTYRPSNTRGVPDYKYPQNTSPALRINEGHKLADFYSATTASCGVSVVQYCSASYSLAVLFPKKIQGVKSLADGRLTYNNKELET